MNKKIGFLQGRLSIPPESDVLQYVPENWESEFSLAKILNFGFIEYFNDPQMKKVKNENNLSMYVTKTYCLTSTTCRYIIAFMFIWCFTPPTIYFIWVRM